MRVCFQVPEYVILPTFVTSPVLALPHAVPLQHGARAAALWGRGEHSYASFARTMHQTRDLLLWLLVQLGMVALGDRQQLLALFDKVCARGHGHVGAGPREHVGVVGVVAWWARAHVGMWACASG